MKERIVLSSIRCWPAFSGTAHLVSLPLVALALLSACTTGTSLQTEANKALSTTYGQLFCELTTVAGPTVVGVIDAEASGAPGMSAPVAVLATNATAAAVRANCQRAAASIGASYGIPVSPPPLAPGNVAITPEKV